MDKLGEEQSQQSDPRDPQHTNIDSQRLKDSADFLPDSVYFVNRQNKSKSSVVVLDGDLGKDSPLEWDGWTTNSDESSTISVVMQPGYGKTGLINDDDFQTSSSFEFQSKKNSGANEPTRSYADFEKENLTSRLKQNADDFHNKKHSAEFLENERQEKEKKSTSATKISDPRSIHSMEVKVQSDLYMDEKQKSDKSDYATRYRNLAPKIEEPVPEPREEKLRVREYSPSYRDIPRSRDSSATRFVAIDAYLGLKDNSNPDQEELIEIEKCREREERREMRRIEMEVMEERRQKREQERGERRYVSSLERNKETSARKEESRRREEEKMAHRGDHQGADKNIKEDLCSSLLTIKNASVSPEERRYSEVYLTGLKRLTATESDSKTKQEKFYGSASTDDSKSWYQSRMSDSKLVSDQGMGKSPRSVTPVNHEQEKYENKTKSEVKNGETIIPGFLSKTQQLDVEKKLDQNIHFDSEFPTFSAYLKRTYGQSYTYRTRESSETSEKGEKRNNDEKNLKSIDESQKTKDTERSRVNDLSYEYSISDKASQKINEQQNHKDAEHISRKANFDIEKDKVLKSNASNNEDLNDSNSFLSRSKESIYESSGSAPSNSECFSKQLIKNNAATKSKSSKTENRDASPTIDLLKRSFESLQYALNNKELELMSPKACQDLRRVSPSPERTPEPHEGLSDSSQSRSRSRTKKRTVQSQSRSRESSQKMRLKEIAPTFYEAKYNGGLDKRSLDREDRILRNEESYLSERGFHPQNNVHNDSLRGAESEHFSHLNQRYAEKYPMDLDDEDISVMKKFIHHKKDELPSELFCMDVETFKKLYVQNRVLEMKREASVSRRSSITSNINDQENINRNQSNSGNLVENDPPCPELGEDLYSSSKMGSRRPDHGSAEAQAHTPREYGSPMKKSVAVQMQASGPAPALAPQKSRSRHKTQVDMEDVLQASLGLSLNDHEAQAQRVQRNDHLQMQVYQDQMWASQQQEIDYPCFSRTEDLHHVNKREFRQSHKSRDYGAQVNQEDLGEQRHQDGKVFDPHLVKYQQQNQQQPEHRQPEYNTRNLTYSQKQALKDFDAYELKNLEIENRKLTVINDDLLKLWEQTQAENTRLRLELSGVKNENETLKHQLGSAAQQVTQINAVTDAEKREKQIVLKKLAEMEEELKLLALSENLTDQTLDQLKADNARLRQENEALIRAMTQGKQK